MSQPAQGLREEKTERVFRLTNACSSRRVLAKLGNDRVAVFSLAQGGTMTVGRDIQSDLILEDPSISRVHATIAVGESIVLEDAGSLNGIFVGDRRLGPRERHVWSTGQVAQLGQVELLLIDETAPPASQVAKERTPIGTDDEAGRVLSDPAMMKLDGLARSVAAGTISVLLMGETGSGKEIFAETIHRHSTRGDKPFVSLNCAALTETLLESELFGHERGAFTGAAQTKAGLLESADGGTVFLDEVGEMSLGLQAKLLRVLETRKVTRVGGLKAKSIDLRFVAATNRDLEMEVARGTFRRDLFYRINGVILSIPPLRERPSEIEPLARLFAARESRTANFRRTPDITLAALDRLRAHSWPGNVRELRNVIERAVLLCGGDDIDECHLALARFAPATISPGAPIGGTNDAPRVRTGSDRLRIHGDASSADEKSRILEVLTQCGGNQTRAAKLLGMARQTLIRRIAEYGIPRPKREQTSLERTGEWPESEEGS
jgi:DNA-binding NtrC family response regulator